MEGPGLALDWRFLLEISDGGQWDSVLLVFSLAGLRRLLWGLPVLLCSWAGTLRVVDVLCSGASVRLRMREVILLETTTTIDDYLTDHIKRTLFNNYTFKAEWRVV